jgi:hypothetical protein
MSKPNNKKEDNGVKPFVPALDEQGNEIEPVVVKPVQETDGGVGSDKIAKLDVKNSQGGDAPLEDNFKTYKSIYSGVTPIPVIIDGVKRYLKFDKHTYRTDNIEEQQALEEIMETDKSLPPKNRRVLNVDDFLELTSPDKVFIDIDGDNLHISEVREAVAIAKKHGWQPTGKKVIILNTRSKVNQGGVTASQGGI